MSLLHGFSSQLLVLLTFDNVSGFLSPTDNQRKHAQYCPSILCALHSAEGEECLAYAAHSLETSLMFLDKRKAGVYLVQCMVQCLEQCIVSLKEFCVFCFIVSLHFGVCSMAKPTSSLYVPSESALLWGSKKMLPE